VVSSLQLFQQSFVYISHLPHACYVTRPPHARWLDYPNNIWRSLQVTELINSLVQPPAPSSLLVLSILITLFSPAIFVLPIVWGTKFHTHTKQQTSCNLH
jgi:hypothetical protein